MNHARAWIYIIALKEEVNNTTVCLQQTAVLRPFLLIVSGFKWSVRFTVKPLGDKFAGF